VYRQFKFIWPLLLTVASFALNTTVVRKSGTIIVIGASKNKIVVAADSRGKFGPGKYADHQCKITALSDKFVFASNGEAGISVDLAIPYRPISIDVPEQARIAFKSVDPKSDDFLYSVAVLWGRNISSLFNEAVEVAGPQVVLAGNPDAGAINGYFFGSSPGLVLYMENTYRSGNRVLFDKSPAVIPLTDTIRYSPHGAFRATVLELREGKTERAKKEAVQWERQSATFPVDDRDVLKAVRWVQLTLDDHPGSDEIGGPIDSLTITPLGGVHWHSQKKECQEDYP
jgi:hypothetical protein